MQRTFIAFDDPYRPNTEGKWPQGRYGVGKIYNPGIVL